MWLALSAGIAHTGAAPVPVVPHVLPLARLLSLSEPTFAPIAPALDPSHLIITTRTNEVQAFALPDGHRLWSAASGSATSVAIGDELVFVSTNDNVQALDVASGTPRWTIAAHASRPLQWQAGQLFVTTDIPELPFWRSGLSHWAPATAAIGLVTAYRTSDGRQIWQHNARTALSAAPTIDSGQIVLPLSSRALRSLATDTGKLLWEEPLSAVPDAPVIARGHVYVGTADRQFYTLSAENGRWSQNPSQVLSRTAAAPVVDETRVYAVAIDGIFGAFEHGTLKWKHALDSRPVAAPLADSGIVFLPLNPGQVYLYLANLGEPAGMLTVADATATFAPPPFLVSCGHGESFELVSVTEDAKSTVMFTVYARGHLDVSRATSDPGVPMTWPPLSPVPPTSR